jgi:methanethiol S-methyltransferase
MGTLLLVLASALWGLIHSLTASLKLKEAARKALGAPGMNWYRLIYNSFSVITFLPVLAMAAMLPDVSLYAIPEPWAVVALILQFVAVVFLVIGVLQTDVWSFMGFSQITGTPQESKIVTGGLYRYVRHPLYSAGLAFIWLTPVMTLNRMVLYACLTLYIFIGAYFEERKLVREFGKDYQEYRARTPMVIPIPFRSMRKNLRIN